MITAFFLAKLQAGFLVAATLTRILGDMVMLAGLHTLYPYNILWGRISMRATDDPFVLLFDSLKTWR